MEYDIIVSMVVIHYSQRRTLDGVVTKHIYNCRHSSTPSRRRLDEAWQQRARIWLQKVTLDYRVAKTHGMSCLCKLFSAQEPYNYWASLQKETCTIRHHPMPIRHPVRQFNKTPE